MSKQNTTSRICIPPEIEAEMTPAVKAFVAQLIARIKELEEKVQKLTPQNSSVPPSTQHPHARPKPKPKKGKNKRKQGGQKGHAKHSRELIATEECNDVIPCIPNQCRRCGDALEGTDPEPIRHQVWDLPPITPIVTEYQQHRLPCFGCGITTCGVLPPGVPTGQCGPRLAAFIGLLMGHFRQSKRRAAMFLEDLLNVPCSAGWTVKIQNIVSDSLAAAYEQLRSELSKQKQLFVDESPTKQKNTKAWLWVAVAPMFAVFGIFLNRKRSSLKALVGDYWNIILNCDRAKMYFDCKCLQWCWAHLKRDIQKLRDSSDKQVKRLGDDLMRQQKLLFQHWRRYKEGEIQWATFQKSVRPVRKKFEALLLREKRSGNKGMTGMCKELYNHREWLWTFTKVEGIEPTNNTAERSLRPAVIYRKLSFGTQSATGSRFVERILTVSETCRIQGRSVFEFMVDAVTAHFANQTSPSLLPQSGMSEAPSRAA
jgi:transposase